MTPLDRLTRRVTFAGLVLATMLFPAFRSPAAQTYQVLNLVSNQTNAKHTDSNLVNAWGIAYFPGAPFWLSDAGTGKSTLYDGRGNPQSLVVTVPPASGTGVGSPTGIVANATSDFVVSGNGTSGPAFFIYDTLDGTISGWNPSVSATGTDAVIAVNNSNLGSVYTGLAIGVNNGANFLYAADNGPRSVVDMFDGSFNLVGSFTDPHLPAGFAPFNVQNINGQLYVTFGTFGGSSGFVDVFDTSGKLLQHFAEHGSLAAPWGLALAPSDFGLFSNALLVGNLTNGRISAFDKSSGAFLGLVMGGNGKPVSINGLWALSFGGGSPPDGALNHLYFSAGPGFYMNGLFGYIAAK